MNSCPTPVLFGVQDAVVPARHAEDFRAGIRNVETTAIAEAGHMLPYEQPQRVIDMIGREPRAG